jgi:hypothetical protein
MRAGVVANVRAGRHTRSVWYVVALSICEREENLCEKKWRGMTVYASCAKPVPPKDIRSRIAERIHVDWRVAPGPEA